MKTYDLGLDSKGEQSQLTIEKIRDFFFDILLGKIEIQNMDGNFNIGEINGKFN